MAYISSEERYEPMTRQQIVEFTAETDRRVAANEIGLAPRNERHVRRLAELKAEAERSRQDCPARKRVDRPDRT
jgi:hypothetical protein